MTQTQIEKFDNEEYSHFLSYGEPYADPAYADMYSLDALGENDSHSEWISTLDSTTYPGTTFGYRETVLFVPPYMYTSL